MVALGMGDLVGLVRHTPSSKEPGDAVIKSSTSTRDRGRTCTPSGRRIARPLNNGASRARLVTA